MLCLYHVKEKSRVPQNDEDIGDNGLLSQTDLRCCTASVNERHLEMLPCFWLLSLLNSV